MRSAWGLLAGALVLAFLMQLINCLFEAAGSVPDLEGCGFLAGGLGTLAVAYPTLAGMTAYRASRGNLLPRDRNISTPIWGGFIGAGGASLYFGAGFLLAFFRGHYGAISTPAVLWSMGYVALCWAGGWAGAAYAQNTERPLAWRDTGG